MTREQDPVVANNDATEVTIRRAPKYSAFMAVFVVLFLIVALVLTLMFPEVEGETNHSQVFGFLVLPALALGLAVGGVVAVIVDKLSKRTERTVLVVHEEVAEPIVAPQAGLIVEDEDAATAANLDADTTAQTGVAAEVDSEPAQDAADNAAEIISTESSEDSVTDSDQKKA